MGRLFVMVPVTPPTLVVNLRQLVHKYLGLGYIYLYMRYNYLERLGWANIVCTPKRLPFKLRGRKIITGRTYIEVTPLEDDLNANT